jgi:hypothetical protein
MSQNKSKYQFWQEASLSQKLADKIPMYQKLAGSDQEISDSIAVLTYVSDPKNLEKTAIEFTIGLLDMLRMSHFATSDKVNEITKMGMQMPKGENIVSKYTKDEE